jgi:hypothetical protein
MRHPNKQKGTPMNHPEHTPKSAHAGRSRTIGTGFFAMLANVFGANGTGARKIAQGSAAAVAGDTPAHRAAAVRSKRALKIAGPRAMTRTNESLSDPGVGDYRVCAGGAAGDLRRIDTVGSVQAESGSPAADIFSGKTRFGATTNCLTVTRHLPTNKRDDDGNRVHGPVMCSADPGRSGRRGRVARAVGRSSYARATAPLTVLLTLGALALTAAPALATGDANRAQCHENALGEPLLTEESPGFRSFLPECRAYELVTPPYTAGAIVYGLGQNQPPVISANGEHLLGVSFGDYGGSENLEQDDGEYGARYEFSRTPAGWDVEALDPPASEFPRREFLFPSADLTRSLWRVQVPSRGGEEFGIPEIDYDGWTLAVREAVGDGKGHFALVGPVVAPGHQAANENVTPDAVAGASADLTDILLTVRAERKQLWPGDDTVAGRQSLYEYMGTSKPEPTLVGVANSGPLDGTPHANEGADLISECGTAFESVSASGGLVYFTAQHVEGCAGVQPPASELYARADGVSTVNVSEPPFSLAGRQCSGVCETDETVLANRREAVFQGASANGAKVFFTSTQPLVNAAVGHGIGLYEATVAGEGIEAHVSSLVLLAGEVSTVSAVAGEGARVYFTSMSPLTVEPNANGEKALTGVSNLFVAGATGLAFVAREPASVQTTQSGEYAVFADKEPLAETDDTSRNVEQLFEYTASTGAVVRVSIGAKGDYECPETKVIEEGFNCNGNTDNTLDIPSLTAVNNLSGGQFAGRATFPAAASSYLSVAENGVVVFASALALTPQAPVSHIFEERGCEGVCATENVYEYRAGNVYLVSGGEELAPLTSPRGRSRLLGIDASGEDVFFRTTSSLVPQDTATQSSWYDAREEGGFPAPVMEPGCFGETCQGAPPTAPVLSRPGSGALTASGNLAPPASVPPAAKPAAKKAVKCPKVKKLTHGKCVKTRVKQKARKSSNDRRAK